MHKQNLRNTIGSRFENLLLKTKAPHMRRLFISVS